MKKKILFITPQLPYPPISGGTIRTKAILDSLIENFDVYLLGLLKNEDINSYEVFKKLYNDKVSYIRFFPHNLENSKRNISNFVKSLLSKIPLTVYRNKNPYLQKELAKIIKKEFFDYIFLDHYISWNFIVNIKEDIRKRNIKIVTNTHNCEYLIWKRYAIIEKNIIKKAFLFFESFRIKKFEKYIYNYSDKVITISLEDYKKINNLTNKNNTFIVPATGDEKLLSLPDLNYFKTQKILLFVGTLSWEPNLNGLIWFIKNCWKELKKDIVDLKLYIVGKNPPKKLSTLTKNYNDIYLIGFVENLNKLYEQSRVFISPIFFGSGIKIKNLNAMYRGLPLVTTSLGAEGIEGKDSIHFCIANNKNEFIKKIKLLLTNEKIWYIISKNSRNLVRNKYTYKNSSIILKNILK